MTRRSPAELDRLGRRLGRDLALSYPAPSGWWEDADLAVTSSGRPRRWDLARIEGIAAADQFLANRLKTRKGELAALGHPEYGSRHHELIGEPNVDRTRNLVKLHVLEALGHEPRVKEITRCVVRPDRVPPRDTIRIEIDLVLLEDDTPVNLVVPFSLATGAS